MLMSRVSNFKCKQFYNNSGLLCGILAGFVCTFAIIRIFFPTTLTKSSCNLPFGKDSELLIKQQIDYLKIVNDGELNYEFESNDTVASGIAKKVRIFCWIYTIHHFHESRAKHVKATWAQHCTKFLFFSSANDSTLPAIDPELPLGKKFMWRRTKWIVKYIYDNYLDEYDWFFRADDDAYVIMENLRLMLLPHSPDELIYFGCKLRGTLYSNYDFPQGGAGYVLSRSALKLLVEKGLNDTSKCTDVDSLEEDQFISVCLTKIGVTFGDSRDAKGRHRFLGDFIGHYLVPDSLVDPTSQWLQDLSAYPLRQGPDCCSDYLVGFHYTDVKTMYLLEFLIYNFKAYGVRIPIENNQNYLKMAEKIAKETMGPEDQHK